VSLDFGRALEDREDRASHRMREILYSSAKPLSTMDLHRIFGGDLGGQQLRHAGLEIAVPALVLFPGGVDSVKIA
jgi:hypothetical protein